MKDEKSLNAVMEQYKTLVIPAYQAKGIQNTAKSKSLNDVLNQDINGFMKQIANANAVIDNVGSTFNYQI